MIRAWRPGGSRVGGVAQLGEHLLCKQGVIGSIPIVSTRRWAGGHGAARAWCLGWGMRRRWGLASDADLGCWVGMYRG
jgi:hypothetical protein